jgi:hypothetical protein
MIKKSGIEPKNGLDQQNRCIFTRFSVPMPIKQFIWFVIHLFMVNGLVLNSWGSSVHDHEPSTTGFRIVGPNPEPHLHQYDSNLTVVSGSFVNLTRPDSLHFSESAKATKMIVVPSQWRMWVQAYRHIPKTDSRRLGNPSQGNRATTTTAFLISMLGMFLLAVDWQRFVQMTRAFMFPRLFEQFLRQQSNRQGSGWSVARVFYSLFLLASCVALFRFRVQETTMDFAIDGFQIFCISVLILACLQFIHFLLGVAFAQTEWTYHHIKTNFVFFQCSLPVLLIAVVLTASLPMRMMIGSMMVTAALLLLGWIYRLILGWIKSLNAKGVGLGYIIFYFCLFEFLPLILLLKYAADHLI